jgi:hypothetical protein
VKEPETQATTLAELVAHVKLLGQVKGAASVELALGVRMGLVDHDSHDVPGIYPQVWPFRKLFEVCRRKRSSTTSDGDGGEPGAVVGRGVQPWVASGPDSRVSRGTP